MHCIWSSVHRAEECTYRISHLKQELEISSVAITWEAGTGTVNVADCEYNAITPASDALSWIRGQATNQLLCGPGGMSAELQ